MSKRPAELRLALPFVAALAACLVGPASRAAGASAEAVAAGGTTQAIVDSLAPEVEKHRGLKFKRSVPVERIEADTVREYVTKRVRQFRSEGQIAGLESAYRLLGLLPAGTDLLQTYITTVEQQAAGFYDPDTGAFYLLGDMPASLLESVIAHELTHALEDQHFDLDGRLGGVVHDDDRAFALGAVHEGSAMLLMTALAGSRLLQGEVDLEELQHSLEAEQERTRALLDLPPVLVRQLLGTYVLGAGFLTRGNLLSIATEGYPGQRVDRVFRDGPVSSEQILHPDKYWNEERDAPQRVRLGDAGELLGRGWEKGSEGVLGELVLAVLTGAEASIDSEALMSGGGAWTNAAAEGWDGDLWQLWSRADSSALLFGSVWDSREDAEDFAAALSETQGLAWKRSGPRVAIVAGDLGARIRRRLLDRILKKMSAGPG